jgi:hypothetical protein
MQPAVERARNSKESRPTGNALKYLAVMEDIDSQKPGSLPSDLKNFGTFDVCMS